MKISKHDLQIVAEISDIINKEIERKLNRMILRFTATYLCLPTGTTREAGINIEHPNTDDIPSNVWKFAVTEAKLFLELEGEQLISLKLDTELY